MLNSNKRLRIDHLIHMSEEAPPTLDDLMDTACDLLDSCRDRGIDIGPEKIMIERAMTEGNSARLEQHIARIKAMMPPVLVPLRRLWGLRRLSPILLQYLRNPTTAFQLIMPAYLLLRHCLLFPAIPEYQHCLQFRNSQGAGVQNHEFHKFTL
jgi:hypothetical protein